MKPTVLFLFNSSIYAPEPWLRDGRFNVISVDYDRTDHSEAHRHVIHNGHHRMACDLSIPDAREELLERLDLWGLLPPSLAVSFAPCTDLAVSGARHFRRKLERDPECQHRAVRMAKLASTLGCPYIIENPVSVLSTMWRKPDHICHPYHFAGYIPEADSGHPEFPGLIPDRDRYLKKTCYWTGLGFRMPMWDGLDPIEDVNHGWAKLGGKSARTKYIRSLTPRGFSEAIYQANSEKTVDMPLWSHYSDLIETRRRTQ